MGILRQAKIVLFLSFLFTAQSLAGDLPHAAPGDVGLSQQGLQRIEDHLTAAVDAGYRSGYVAMVARRGRVAFEFATGVRDIDGGLPMTLDTRFRIASMTKPITSLAVMMLVEEEKLQLSDPVSRYLPEFANLSVATSTTSREDGAIATRPAKQQITVRQLLTHTAGLGYVLDFDTDLGRAFRQANIHYGPASLAEMTRALASQPLYFEPGDKWQYSFATDVLGRLVEVVSGQPFDSFVEQRIFEPLGMDDTDFIIDKNHAAHRADRLAIVYRFLEDGSMLAMTPDDVSLGGMEATDDKPPSPEILRWPSGGAGLVSTAGDYMRFLLMMADGGKLGHARLVSPATIERMTRSDVAADKIEGSFLGDPAAIGFGLGYRVVIDAGLLDAATSDGEYSWGGYFGTWFFVAPGEDGLIAILLAQRQPGPHMPNNRDGVFNSLVYGAITD